MTSPKALVTKSPLSPRVFPLHTPQSLLKPLLWSELINPGLGQELQSTPLGPPIKAYAPIPASSLLHPWLGYVDLLGLSCTFSRTCEYSVFSLNSLAVFSWISAHWQTMTLPNKCLFVLPKGNQSWIFIGRTDVETPILWPPDVKNYLFGKDPGAGKD